MHPLTALAMHAHALQKPDELDQFFDRALGVKSVIEIGCDAGGMLAPFRKLTEHVLGIDLPGGPWGSNRPLSTWGATVILGNSHDDHVFDMAEAWSLGLPLESVDLLFIDGDHTYTGVKMDYEMYSPLVRKGGMIVLQDIVPHTKHPDVKVDQFWNEIKGVHEYREIISEDGAPWAGIGILYKE
jgi:hypothetical protein